MPDFIKTWWITRGIAGAISIIAIVSEAFNLSRYESLQLLHILISRWNHLLDMIGIWIGELPLLPQIDSEFLNAAAIFGICYPGLNSLVKYTDNSEPNLGRYTRAALSLMWGVLIFLCSAVLYDIAARTPDVNTHIDGIIGRVYDFYLGNPRDHHMWIWWKYSFIFTISFFILIILSGVFLSVKTSEPIRRGFLFTVGLIGTVEGLYAAAQPWVSNELKNIICRFHAEIPAYCVTPLPI